MTRPGALLLALLACACGSDDEEQAAAPQYAEIEAQIFKPNCTFACHSGGEFAAGGLDMQAPPHQVLVDVAATAPGCAGINWSRVVAGQPMESLLYMKIVAKLEDKAAPCGESMPSGANRGPLTAEQVEQVRVWIEAGATAD